MPPHTADKDFACGKKIRFSNFEPLHRRARRDAQKAFQAGPPPLRRFYMGWVKGRSKGNNQCKQPILNRFLHRKH